VPGGGYASSDGTSMAGPHVAGLVALLVSAQPALAGDSDAIERIIVETAHPRELGDNDCTPGPGTQQPNNVYGYGEIDALAAVRRALERFVGPGRQRPPAYSAKHVDGERSYRLARRGEAVEPAEVAVMVHAVEWLGWTPPELEFRITVSAGTYIRAVARDLGAALGVGGHLRALRREAIGALRVEEAVPLDAVGPRAVRAPAAVLPHLPAVPLDRAGRDHAVHGRRVAEASGRPGELARLMAGEELVAIARREAEGWQPVVVLGTA